MKGAAGVVRMNFAIALHYEVADTPADFIFNIHAAQTARQSVVDERLEVTPDLPTALHVDPLHGGRYLRLTAPAGVLDVRYRATVDLAHHFEPPARIAEVPIAALPDEVLPFLYPSRYCQSDRLQRIATREFGHLRPGYWRVQAIRDWVYERTAFTPGVTHSSTCSVDTLLAQAGVCRDFAHLMIALCRAVNVPARFVTGIDYGAPRELGPPDFHAYVEAYLGDRWYLFDPTGISPPMGLVRIGTGRDAAEVSFATMFGAVRSFSPTISIEAVDDPGRGFEVPRPRLEAVSSAGGEAAAPIY